jgi:maltooligosyltrehalose trehalohydrolase
MERQEKGYHEIVADGIEPGALYYYRLDGQMERPDPASRSQPQGVHGPSQVVTAEFPWKDERWCGLPLRDYVLYELHVGTFTSEGTFDAIRPHLNRLKTLGITAIELMPVAQFPGNRNWGYDGVYPFAVQNSYGGPRGLKRFVNGCHQNGLAVVLDVVYNHLGPEGNYLGDYGPYFTDRYKTPWGSAINFDGPESDEVRRFFFENAIHWVREFHIDALRIDAVHAIMDFSASPFLSELAVVVHDEGARLNRRIAVIPESALNDTRLIQPRELGGYGLDAQWNDDFHHALHVLLTGERTGYYQDFGEVLDLVKAFRDGFVYDGRYSKFRRRRHGNTSRAIPADRFLVFSQNHDQIGNRMMGDRLSQSIAFEGLKLAAGVVLLSPFIPLLFMGEEYGETAPFPYFVSHSDPDLIKAVREGRQNEFAAFGWTRESPDPQSEETFLAAKLNHHVIDTGQHRVLFRFYQELLRLRRNLPALCNLVKEDMEVYGHETKKIMTLRRWHDGEEALAFFYFGMDPVSVDLSLPQGRWHKVLDASDTRWLGPGTSLPRELDSARVTTVTLRTMTCVLFQRKEET